MEMSGAAAVEGEMDLGEGLSFSGILEGDMKKGVRRNEGVRDDGGVAGTGNADYVLGVENAEGAGAGGVAEIGKAEGGERLINDEHIWGLEETEDSLGVGGTKDAGGAVGDLDGRGAEGITGEIDVDAGGDLGTSGAPGDQPRLVGERAVAELPGIGTVNTISGVDFAGMGYLERLALKKEHPELYAAVRREKG